MNKEQISFTTTDIAKEIDIPRNRLKEWQRLGYINQPSIEKSAGSGTAGCYSVKDLCEIHLFSFLLKFGVSRDIASLMIRSDDLVGVLKGKIVRGR